MKSHMKLEHVTNRNIRDKYHSAVITTAVFAGKTVEPSRYMEVSVSFGVMANTAIHYATSFPMPGGKLNEFLRQVDHICDEMLSDFTHVDFGSDDNNYISFKVVECPHNNTCTDLIITGFDKTGRKQEQTHTFIDKTSFELCRMRIAEQLQKFRSVVAATHEVLVGLGE